jgi:hypothetical protein
MTLNLSNQNHDRLAIHHTLMQCMALLNSDAATYQPDNIQTSIIWRPPEPDMKVRSHQTWTELAMGIQVSVGDFTMRPSRHLRESLSGKLDSNRNATASL